VREIILESYAKVNLFLDVLGKFPDGYHELLTVFERVSLADRVTVERVAGSEIRLECDAPGVPADATNLAVKAALAYRAASGWNDGLRIVLQKKIPAGGGMGGGSSNAAAVLLALDCLSGQALARAPLIDCARALGADVAFFMEQKPFGIGRHRGDQIDPLPLEKTVIWHLLVTPDFPVPTKNVYQALRLTPQHPDVKIILGALEKRQVAGVQQALYNALEPTVEALYPAIAQVKDRMMREGKVVSPVVSGSGSTVFAVCASEAEAKEAAERLQRLHPEWRVSAARTA
jgi:4-diphosphocytidyl-2-C-methyl-D-erythritol kinase